MPLRVQTDDGRALTIEGQSATIGRSSECDIVIRSATDLADIHARVRRVGDRVLVESLEGANLYVEGQSPNRLLWLSPGDMVRLTKNGPSFIFDPRPEHSESAFASPSETTAQNPMLHLRSRYAVAWGIGLLLGSLLLAVYWISGNAREPDRPRSQDHISSTQRGGARENSDLAAHPEAGSHHEVPDAGPSSTRPNLPSEADLTFKVDAGAAASIADDSRDGVVWVGVTSDTGALADKHIPLCTGWLVGSSEVVTSGLAIVEMRSSVLAKNLFVAIPGDPIRYVAVASLRVHPKLDQGDSYDLDYDVGVLQLAETLPQINVLKRYRPLGKESWEGNLLRVAYHIPESPFRPVESHGTSPLISDLVTVMRTLPADPDAIPTLAVSSKTSLTVDLGCIGAPVFAENGRVVGTFCCVENRSPWIVPVDRLLDLGLSQP